MDNWTEYLGGMRLRLLPSSAAGKWSLGFILVFFVSLGFFFLMANTGQHGGEHFFSNLYLAIPILLAVAASFVSAVLGVAGIFVRRDFSIMVLLAVLIGLFVCWFFSMEILSPHPQ